MERRSFRQWGQLMVGTTLALIAVGVAWAMLTGGMERSAGGLAWMVLLLVLSYAVFVRPCVVVDADGVTLRNILRDVRVPWASILGARSAWNLEVQTTAGSHSAWAVSGTASPARDALARRSAAGVGGAAAPAKRAASGHVDRVDAAAVHSGLTPPATGASAAAVAALIERERARHADAPRGPEGTAPPVRVVVAWVPVTLLLVASAAVFLVQAF